MIEIGVVRIAKLISHLYFQLNITKSPANTYGLANVDQNTNRGKVAINTAYNNPKFLFLEIK